jgi:hypothetical protein
MFSKWARIVNIYECIDLLFRLHVCLKDLLSHGAPLRLWASLKTPDDASSPLAAVAKLSWERFVKPLFGAYSAGYPLLVDFSLIFAV